VGKRSKKCFFHPTRDARASCLICSKPLCLDCAIVLVKSHFCHECTKLLIEAVLDLLIEKGVAKAEKRKSLRMYTVFPAEIILNDGTLVNAIVVNISKGGIGVLTHERLNEQTTVKLKFTLPGTENTLTLEGGVLRTERIGAKHFYSGIIFMNLGNLEKDIENFVTGKVSKYYIRFDKKITFV
jgi:hypothetical protein